MKSVAGENFRSSLGEAIGKKSTVITDDDLLFRSRDWVCAPIISRRLRDAGDILKMVNGQLRASDAGADRQLGEAIATTIRGGATPGAKAAGLALAAGDGTRYVAHALPFGSATRQSSAIPLASLAFFVSKTAIDPPSLPEAIGRAYKLTATELRVLLAIVDAGGAPEVADALGVAASTVKTHLARLYEKTGARRQADLVKIVAGFSTPLR